LFLFQSQIELQFNSLSAPQGQFNSKYDRRSNSHLLSLLVFPLHSGLISLQYPANTLVILLSSLHLAIALKFFRESDGFSFCLIV
jgi:hypothetical protein